MRPEPVPRRATTHATAPAARRFDRRLVAVAAAAVASPLVWVLVTGQIWEDFFITFRYAENLVRGLGLVYNAGERVYGFTSPINTLLPALFFLLTGARSYEPALWLYRAVSVAAFAASVVLVVRERMREQGGDALAWLVVAGCLVLEPKAVGFAVNGQESAFMMLFMAAGLVLASRGVEGRPVATGLVWAGLEWTRPDGVVYAAILAAVDVAFARGPRRRELAGLARAAGVAALAYAPWAAWAWWYYGTLVPESVIAKAAAWRLPLSDPAAIVRGVLKQLPDSLTLVWEPSYAQFGSWPYWTKIFSLTAGGLCATTWALRSADRFGRMASLAAVLAGVYLGWVQLQRLIYPWYFPPMVLCAAAALPSGLAALGRALARPRAALLLSRALGAVAVVAVGATFVLCLVQTRIGQREVDWGVRAAIGEWLRENTGPTDTILLEPIGYIGYFSGRHILDYPGLVTPEVVRLRRDKGADYVMTIAELRPDWVVVRAEEYQNVMRSDVLRALYRPAGEWNTIPRIEQYPWIPEPRGVVYDAHYVVLRRAG